MLVRTRLKKEWTNFSHDVKTAWENNPYLIIIILATHAFTLPLIAAGYYEWLEERRKKNALDMRLREQEIFKKR